MTIELKQDTYLKGATFGQFDRELRVYDDGMGPLWVCGEEFGASWIIRAQSFEDAWGIWIDESPTIPMTEVHEAYDMDYEEFHSKSHAERNEEGEWPDLIEGYEYQSNATGTGIVCTGHYGWLRELTPELMKEMEIKLDIATYE